MSAPAFSYTGAYETQTRSGGEWAILLKTSGTLRMADNQMIDAFLVGGGGGGGTSTASSHHAGSGGGGGYVRTLRRVPLFAGTDYPVEIGAGGAAGEDGNETRAFAASAAGGSKGALGSSAAGGSGGSGGGGAEGFNGPSTSTGGGGGSDGEDGTKPTVGGKGGRGSTHLGAPYDRCAPNTREFGEESGALYAGGGGGGGAYHDSNNPRLHAGGAGGAGGGGNGGGGNLKDGAAQAGTPNTGGGGGGCGWKSSGGAENIGAAGGSGVVVLRAGQESEMPIRFNGTTLTGIRVNGHDALAVEYRGKRLTPCTILTLTADASLEGASVTATGTDALTGHTDTQTEVFQGGRAVFRLRHRTAYELRCGEWTEVYWNLQYGEESQAFPTQFVEMIPLMTSPTAPSGTITYAGGYLNGRQPYRAFDRNDASAWTSGANPSSVWLKYEFPEAIPPIRMIDILCINEGYTGAVNPNGTTVTVAVSVDDDNYMDIAEIHFTPEQMREHVRLPLMSMLGHDEPFRYLLITPKGYMTSNSAAIASFQCYARGN